MKLHSKKSKVEAIRKKCESITNKKTLENHPLLTMVLQFNSIGFQLLYILNVLFLFHEMDRVRRRATRKQKKTYLNI